MAETRAQSNRKIRQDALREQLANKGLLQQVIETAAKLLDLDEELDALKVQRLRAAAEIQLKLVAKYLPDLKSVEMSGPDGDPLQVEDVSSKELARKIAYVLAAGEQEEATCH